MQEVRNADTNKKLATILRQFRKKAGLTQQQVAQQLGRTQSYVSKVESGQRRIDLAEAKEFAAAFHIDWRRLIKDA